MTLLFFWRSPCAEGLAGRSKEFVGLVLRWLALERFRIDPEKVKMNSPP